MGKYCFLNTIYIDRLKKSKKYDIICTPMGDGYYEKTNYYNYNFSINNRLC